MGEAEAERMTAEAFVAWAMARPEGERYELVEGAPVAMAPERIEHTEAKGLAFLRLHGAIAAAWVPCRAYTDGVTVRVDEHTVYEPDVTVRCGPPLPRGTVVMRDPLILVEVLSPATRGIDLGLKLADYFRIPSLRHYLILRVDRRVVIHHRRGEDGTILTSLLGDGKVRLDPPGLVVEGLFA